MQRIAKPTVITRTLEVIGCCTPVRVYAQRSTRPKLLRTLGKCKLGGSRAHKAVATVGNVRDRVERRQRAVSVYRRASACDREEPAVLGAI